MILNSKNNPWAIYNLTQLFKIVTGSTPSTKSELYWKDGNILWVTPTDLSSLGNNIFISNSERKITNQALNHSNLTLLPIDSIILSTRAPVGYVAINKKELCFNQGCKALVIKDEDKTNSLFYYYYFLFIRNYLESISGGSTFKELSKDSLKNLSVPLPDIAEQNQIANILSTVDEAIQKADEAITKTERIKQAMMQKLLSEGIVGIHPFGRHKEFKQTKIGKTPSDWAIRKIGEVINKSGKIDPTKSNNEFKYVDISSINNQTFKIISTNKIDKNNAPSRARKLIKKDNIIYATTRPYLQNIAIVPQSLDNQICSTGFCVMEPDEKIVSNKWLFYNVITSRFNRRIEAKMKGATYPAVNDSDLYEELISVPSITEQNKITDIFDDLSRKLDLEISRKQSLEKIKQGLMDDLLTSRKRVKIN